MRGVRVRPATPLLAQTEIHSLLVFRALQVGDLLCAVPALRALRAALPHAHITLVGLPWARELLRRFPRELDGVIAFPGHPALPERAVDAEAQPAWRAALAARRADLAIQLHGSGEISNTIVAGFGARLTAGFAPPPLPSSPAWLRYPAHGPEILRLLALTRHLGAPPHSPALAFPLIAEDFTELTASGIQATLGAHAYVCLHAGARDRSKCWPARCFARVGDALARRGLRVVLTGSAAEHDLAAQVAAQMRCPALNAALPLSLGAMAALMSRALLLVCNDTGVSHMAAALRLPSVVVFHRSDPARWAPLDRIRHRCVQDPLGTDAPTVIRQALDLLARLPPSAFAAAGPGSAPAPRPR